MYWLNLLFLMTLKNLKKNSKRYENECIIFRLFLLSLLRYCCYYWHTVAFLLPSTLFVIAGFTDLLTKDKHEVINTWIGNSPANEIQLVGITPQIFIYDKDLLHICLKRFKVNYHQTWKQYKIYFIYLNIWIHQKMGERRGRGRNKRLLPEFEY